MFFWLYILCSFILSTVSTDFLKKKIIKILSSVSKRARADQASKQATNPIHLPDLVRREPFWMVLPGNSVGVGFDTPKPNLFWSEVDSSNLNPANPTQPNPWILCPSSASIPCLPRFTHLTKIQWSYFWTPEIILDQVNPKHRCP